MEKAFTLLFFVFGVTFVVYKQIQMVKNQNEKQNKNHNFQEMLFNLKKKFHRPLPQIYRKDGRFSNQQDEIQDTPFEDYKRPGAKPEMLRMPKMKLYY